MTVEINNHNEEDRIFDKTNTREIGAGIRIRSCLDK